MGMHTYAHQVCIKEAGGEWKDGRDGFLSIGWTQGDCHITLSMDMEAADDLCSRLSAYLMDAQQKAHPETVDAIIQVDE